MRSQEAIARLGAVREGTLRRHMNVRGYQRDTVYFSILDDEWPSVKSRLESRLAQPLEAVEHVRGDPVVNRLPGGSDRANAGQEPPPVRIEPDREEELGRFDLAPGGDRRPGKYREDPDRIPARAVPQEVAGVVHVRIPWNRPGRPQVHSEECTHATRG